MSNTFYLQRTLVDDQRTYSEIALLEASKFIVVLAEPGGGKTELLESLSGKLGVSAVTANVFAQIGCIEHGTALIIDAFDELAKIDAAGIHKLLGNASKCNPTHVIVSSRSSEWGNAATSVFKAFLGQVPLVVRLREFDEGEQKDIFEHHAPGENFVLFRSEVARFDLTALLPNPQFLKLFVEAYIESERHFIDKRSIFEQAVERLAKEVNVDVARSKSALATSKKVQIASEVFAKLLLSGAEGVGLSEANASHMFPLLGDLFDKEFAGEGILASRLFKPGDSADHHRPVHKIVSEYCAAGYLTKRIADPRDPLSLSKCLSVIAPNSTVRDELRGMLGWMASLGDKQVQRAAINLDPYAVLANGDPSQLEPSSKQHLVNRLKDIEDKDPHFRRGDFWRRFSVAGFFTEDVVNEIKPLITQGREGHLRQLILELLAGSPAVEQLSNELRQLLLTPGEDANVREIASRCLLDVKNYDHFSDLAVLIFEASDTSLQIVAAMMEALGAQVFDHRYLESFFRICAHIYPDHDELYERAIGVSYFVKRLVGCLDLKSIGCLLDSLTRGLACQCGNLSYECGCRNGISKIIGFMLDRYFEFTQPPHDVERVWRWVRNLNFHERKAADQSAAVRVLQDKELRQGIIAHVFKALRNQDQIFNIRINNFDSQSHSGLSFHAEDYKFLADLAFEIDNPDLWASFLTRHQIYRSREGRGTDDLRRHMRIQARVKPAFQKEWARFNNPTAQHAWGRRVQSLRQSRKMKRRKRQRNDANAANIKYVQDNRQLVESGRHWGCLLRFASLTLMHPEKIEVEFGDKVLVRTALRNCLDFIDDYVPDLRRLAELQCASKSPQSGMILYAACLEIMRETGTLNAVQIRLLKALRTDINMSYRAILTEERELLRAEVDRLIFRNETNAEDFLRQYVEPQLAVSGCPHPEIWLLRSEEVFSPFRAKLSIEWLRRFRGLALGPLDNLFEIAAEYGSRDELTEIIGARCAELSFDSSDNEDLKKERQFWFIRAWYFHDHTPRLYWDWLKADRETVLALYERSGRMSRSDHPSWPQLSSMKVEAILDAFIDKWPKVYLPGHFGTGSPEGENAYRFLTEVVWSMVSDSPDEAVPVIERLLTDSRYVDLHQNLKSIRSRQIRNRGLRDFEPPSPSQIVQLLDHDAVVTVEGLRELVMEELRDFQRAIDGGEFNSASRFYEKGERLGEVQSTEIIAERLSLRLQPKGISITPEHQLKAAKRSDFTATKLISGVRRLLVTEVKGQWHGELYTAAAAQLYERYSIHPDAEQQGVFLAIWFGTNEKVAGLKKHDVASADELKKRIEMHMPLQLKGLVDVFVLDVSK